MRPTDPGRWVRRVLPDRRRKILQANGIVADPAMVIEEAKRAGLPLELACALLMQETGGGRNEWGHDPTIFVGGYDSLHRKAYGETVTQEAYRAYLAQRGPTGRGGMQGVGPCQLTYYGFQDRADAYGGCWQPRFNIRVGFEDLAAQIRRNGRYLGVKAYNGTGPAADRYAKSVLAQADRWAQWLR